MSLFLFLNGSPKLTISRTLQEAAIATHANLLPGLPKEKLQHLRELYERLDMDNDGTIDIRDLTLALQHEMPHIPNGVAPV